MDVAQAIRKLFDYIRHTSVLKNGGAVARFFYPEWDVQLSYKLSSNKQSALIEIELADSHVNLLSYLDVMSNHLYECLKREFIYI